MKWKERISNLSIKKKIIVYSYLVIVPILLVISIFMFLHNYKRMSSEQNAHGISRAQTLGKSIAELNHSVSETSTYICINSDINRILTSGNAAVLNENSQLWLDKAPVRFIQDTLAIKGYIKTLGIYPENGVTPYLHCLDSSSHRSSIEEIRDTQMYQYAVDQKGRKCWKLIKKNFSDVFWANQSEKIALYREIYDLGKKKALGYLVIGADAGKYQDLCESALEKDSEGILLLNAEGERLISCGQAAKKKESEVISPELIEELQKGESGVFSYKSDTVYFQTDKESGQKLCVFIPKSNITDQLFGIAYTPILMLLGVSIGLFPVLSFVSGKVTGPLQKVNQAMAKFRKGDFQQQVAVETRDEVGEVARCFNKMVTDIRQLIDEKYVMELRKRESELTALQAQINPHFLYNTLDSLYWQAVEADNEEIAENILALSNLFRQVLGEGKSTTTVGQECDLVGAYLTVQKMRFTKRLEYRLQIEEDIREEMIPKLILQPFVENAVVHGFENTDAPCSILVEGRRISEGLEFVIEDTGIGMNEEQVKSLLDTEDVERYKGQRIGRYAIRNVKERLTLMYRENFELLIQSAPGKGTRITLRIYKGRMEKE